MSSEVAARAWAAAGALLVCAFALPAQGNPADTFGLGGRSSALGGAVSASVSDFSANYYNPAGLAHSNRTQLNVGWVNVSPHLSRVASGPSVSNFDGWQLGWVIPGEIASLPVAFGAAAQLSSDRMARVVTFTEDDQRWFIYEHRPEQLYISTNLAVRATRWLSIGAGLTHLTSTRGVLRVTGTAAQRVAGQDEYDSRLEHEVIAELASVRYPNLGARFAVSPALGLALVYRGEGSVQLDFESQITGDLKYGDVAVPTHLLLTSRTTHSFVPQQLTLGASWQAQERLTLNLDATWIDWSRMPSPVTATRSELTFEAEGLLPPALPPETFPRSAHLSDRINLRAGAELALPGGWAPDWCVRLGYAFVPSGVDEDSADNLLDADAHVLSAGAGTRFGVLGESDEPSLEVDVFVQRGQLSPSRFVGRAAEGHWWSFGANIGLAL